MENKKCTFCNFLTLKEWMGRSDKVKVFAPSDQSCGELCPDIPHFNLISFVFLFACSLLRFIVMEVYKVDVMFAFIFFLTKNVKKSFFDFAENKGGWSN